MKKIIASVFSLLLISSLSFAQQLPTSDQIIDKYTTALGGKDAIAKVQDLSIQMTGDVQGMSLEMNSQKKIGNKMLLVVSVVGMGEVQKIQSDGTKAQSVAQGNATALSGNDLKALLNTQAGLFPELNYATAGVKLNVAGIEKISGSDAYKVEAQLEDKKWTEYFDVASGLKVRQVADGNGPMGPTTVTITYSDYKDVSGIKIPHKINQDLGQFQIDLTASKVEVNKNLADSIFEIK